MISVIVPVYNTELYLRKCVESIISQTYTDIELVLINDGSTDDSGKICDEYVSVYKNVQVFHQENQGAASARRRGVELARGEYIAFVDSDDWVEKDFYEYLIGYAVEDVDMVTGGILLEKQNETVEWTDEIASGLYESAQIFTEIIPQIVALGYKGRQGIIVSASNKLFNAQLLKDIIHNIDLGITFGEDAAIVYLVLNRAKKIAITKYCGYHYVNRKNSVTHSYDVELYEKILHFYRCMEKNAVFENKMVLKEMGKAHAFSMLRMITCGIFDIDINFAGYIFPFHKVPRGSRIVLYGAGNVGKTQYSYLSSGEYVTILAWTDANYAKLKLPYVVSPLVINELDYDYIVIAVDSNNAVLEIKQNLLDMKVEGDKIIWYKD